MPTTTGWTAAQDRRNRSLCLRRGPAGAPLARTTAPGWTRARTQAELTVLLERTLRQIPGQRLAFTQPIEMRMNELVSGVRRKFPLHAKAMFQPIQRLVDGGDERLDLARHAVQRKPYVRPIRTDARRKLRRFQKRAQRAAEDG